MLVFCPVCGSCLTIGTGQVNQFECGSCEYKLPLANHVSLFTSFTIIKYFKNDVIVGIQQIISKNERFGRGFGRTWGLGECSAD